MQKTTLLSSAVFLLSGFVIAYFIFAPAEKDNTSATGTTVINSKSARNSSFANPFATKNTDITDGDRRIQILENDIKTIKRQLKNIELTLLELNVSVNKSDENMMAAPMAAANNRYPSMLNQRLYNVNNLIRGGIDPAIAEDIVRRKNSLDFKRLQLQDRAKREHYLNSRRYFDELEEINQQNVSLREELGDDQFDQYLFNSKQNNRIRISSVMLGSAAELAGIKQGDVVLSYDDQRMFSWQELKDATSEGQLGEYVAISIYRNGEIFSFTVPRGPLGVQLGATRLPP